jgi:hypothetical protein
VSGTQPGGTGGVAMYIGVSVLGLILLIVLLVILL